MDAVEKEFGDRYELSVDVTSAVLAEL